jgi:hypothetical protein
MREIPFLPYQFYVRRWDDLWWSSWLFWSTPSIRRQPEASGYLNCPNARRGWVGLVTETHSLPERLVVRGWPDPVAERLGFPANSVYTEATRSKWIFELSECSPGMGGFGD